MACCPDPELPGGCCRYSDRCHASRQQVQIAFKMHGPKCWAFESFLRNDAYPAPYQVPDLKEQQ